MPVPFSENGGFAATTYFLFVPVQTPDGTQAFIGIFDPTSFNDPIDSSSYSYRAEDVIVGRIPVVRRVILVYRDVGVSTITLTVQGIDDNDAIVSASSTVVLGTTNASQKLLTQLVDITLSAFRPQLSISRAAGGGPVSIVSATLIGEVEEVSL